MATVYHDWITQTTDTLKLERLKLHIAEVSPQLGKPNVQADGKGIDRNVPLSYYQELIKQLPKYERLASLESGGLITKIVMRRPEERTTSPYRSPPE